MNENAENTCATAASREAMEKVCRFLKDTGTYYLATSDGKLYIQTGRAKDVSKQLAANPKFELCAFKAETGEWLRLSGELVEDNRVEARRSMLDAYPSLRAMYDENDGNTQALYIKNAKAVFSSFTNEPLEVEF